MGNEQQASEYALLTKQQNRLKEAELTDTESLEESVYEQREEDTNCFGCIKVKRTVLSTSRFMQKRLTGSINSSAIALK